MHRPRLRKSLPWGGTDGENMLLIVQCRSVRGRTSRKRSMIVDKTESVPAAEFNNRVGIHPKDNACRGWPPSNASQSISYSSNNSRKSLIRSNGFALRLPT